MASSQVTQGDIPEFYRQTGRVVRMWANIENQLWMFAGLILGVDQFRARIVLASITGARARREFILRLGETYLDPEVLPEFRRLMDRVKSLGASRNTLAHSTMHINVDGKQNQVFADTFSKRMDGGLDFDFRAFPLNDVAVLADALEKLHGELIALLFRCDGKVLRDARIHRVPPTDDS